MRIRGLFCFAPVFNEHMLVKVDLIEIGPAISSLVWAYERTFACLERADRSVVGFVGVGRGHASAAEHGAGFDDAALSGAVCAAERGADQGGDRCGARSAGSGGCHAAGEYQDA